MQTYVPVMFNISKCFSSIVIDVFPSLSINCGNAYKSKNVKNKINRYGQHIFDTGE